MRFLRIAGDSEAVVTNPIAEVSRLIEAATAVQERELKILYTGQARARLERHRKELAQIDGTLRAIEFELARLAEKEAST